MAAMHQRSKAVKGSFFFQNIQITPAVNTRNTAKNMRQYHIFAIVYALMAGIVGLFTSYYLGSSAGAAISLTLTVIFAVTFLFRKVRG